MKIDTFLAKNRTATVKTERILGRWSTEVTLTKIVPRKRVSVRTKFPDTRKEGLKLAKDFVR